MQIPDEFRKFLEMDDQGMEGFEFMLKDTKLSKRIPPEVRFQYEILRTSLVEKIENAISETYEALEYIRKHPDIIVSQAIEDIINLSKK